MTDDHEADRCARRLKVLADPTRLQVMRLLLEQPQNAGDLQRRTEVEQSLLSHHLKILRDADLIVGVRDGKAVRYSVAEDVTLGKEGAERIHLGCCVLSFDP